MIVVLEHWTRVRRPAGQFIAGCLLGFALALTLIGFFH